MPLINVKLIEDVSIPEQKGRIVEELTDAMVAIEGENMRPVTWVVVEEVRSGDWGIAGKPLTTQDVRGPRRRTRLTGQRPHTSRTGPGQIRSGRARARATRGNAPPGACAGHVQRQHNTREFPGMAGGGQSWTLVFICR